MAEAEQYKQQRLIEEFPDSRYAIMLANPKYELYCQAGQAHRGFPRMPPHTKPTARTNMRKCSAIIPFRLSDFLEGAHRAKFMFIQAMSQLYGGERDSFWSR